MDEKYMVCCCLIDDLLAKGVIEKREAIITKSRVLEEIRRCEEVHTVREA